LTEQQQTTVNTKQTDRHTDRQTDRLTAGFENG